jgi:hypothetical protein
MPPLRMLSGQRDPVFWPRLTTPMVVLAFSVLYCPEDAAEASKALAELVLEAAESEP